MRPTSTGKGVVALVTALGLFVALAAPASANPYSLSITGASTTAPGTWFELDMEAPGPCTSKASTLQALVAGDSTTGTIKISGGWSTQFQLGNPPSGQWYQADFVVANQPPQVTYALGTPWDYNLTTAGPNHVILQMRIYRIPSCAKTDLNCIFTMRVSITGTLSSSTALPTYTPGGITLTGSSVPPQHMVESSCSAPWVGQGVAFTLNMTLV